MKTTEYLYGINAKELADMNYKEALHYKVISATDIMRYCVVEARHTKDYERWYPRYTAALRAKEFNVALLEELLDGNQE